MPNCQGCFEEGKLYCPTCKKLNKPKQESMFCTQECFKLNWDNHKLNHSIYDPFPNYRYTGSLRAQYPLTKREVPDFIQKPDYYKHGNPISEQKQKQIEIVSNEDISKLRLLCKDAKRVLDRAKEIIKPGITTDEIDEVVHDACLEFNSYPSPLNYFKFPKSCCTSVNEVICHGIPDQRKLKEGDIVNVDVSLFRDGVHADLNETYPVGSISQEAQNLIQTTKLCLDEAIKICRPGVMYREIGLVIEGIASKQQMGVVRTYCGHGIHKHFHCPPSVPHYAKNKAIGTMKKGHVFTIEPMITLGNHQEDHWPDNWTAVTRDGKLSAQFEHTILITEMGNEILTLI